MVDIREQWLRSSLSPLTPTSSLSLIPKSSMKEQPNPTETNLDPLGLLLASNSRSVL